MNAERSGRSRWRLHRDLLGLREEPERASSRGQAIQEYAVLIALLMAALVGTQTYLKRRVQGLVKAAADQMSPVSGDTDGSKAQALGMQYESGDRTSAVMTSPGDLLDRRSASSASSRTEVRTDTAPGGGVERTILDDQSHTVGALDGLGTSFSSRTVVSVEQ